MRRLTLIPLVVAACIVSSAQHATFSNEPLSAEKMAIYRDFLSSYDNGSGTKLNVAQTTVAFQARDYDPKGCLKSFKPAELSTPLLHSFASDAFPRSSVVLVDPATHKRKDPGDAIRQGASVDDAVNAGFASGIFTFSEIAFDASHTHAALSYSFVCGGRCGNGGTIVYELSDGKWVRSKTGCATWIS